MWQTWHCFIKVQYRGFARDVISYSQLHFNGPANKKFRHITIFSQYQDTRSQLMMTRIYSQFEVKYELQPILMSCLHHKLVRAPPRWRRNGLRVWCVSRRANPLLYLMVELHCSWKKWMYCHWMGHFVKKTQSCTSLHYSVLIQKLPTEMLCHFFQKSCAKLCSFNQQNKTWGHPPIFHEKWENVTFVGFKTLFCEFLRILRMRVATLAKSKQMRTVTRAWTRHLNQISYDIHIECLCYYNNCPFVYRTGLIMFDRSLTRVLVICPRVILTTF